MTRKPVGQIEGTGGGTDGDSIGRVVGERGGTRDTGN